MSRPALAFGTFALMVAAAAPAATKLEQAPPEHQQLYAEIKPLILKEAQPPFPTLVDSDEGYFWKVSARITPLLRAHEYAKDPAYLEAFVPAMEQILSQRIVFADKPEWNGWWHYKDASDGSFAMTDHETILYYVPVLLFVKEVRQDPALKAKYGVKAEAWFKDVEASIRAWDKRGCWHDTDAQTGYYGHVSQVPEKGTGKLIKCTNIAAGGTVQYNKINALYEALTIAYRITGDPWYRDRMAKSAKFWRAHWRDDGKHVEWNYRDHYLPGDYESGVVGQGKTKTGAWIHPKDGYYALDVQGATWLYDVGIFYQRPDMEKLIKTNLEFMWRGDTPPTFRTINGIYDTSGKANRGHGYLWSCLGHFDPKIRELWKASIDKGSRGWMWHSGALEYLIEMSYPISWEPRYVKEIPKK